MSPTLFGFRSALAQPPHLLDLQPHARHFEIFCADAFEHLLIRRWAHGDLSETTESRDVEPHGTSQVALCLQPVIDIVSVLAASLAVKFKRSTGDIAVGHFR